MLRILITARYCDLDFHIHVALLIAFVMIDGEAVARVRHLEMQVRGFPLQCVPEDLLLIVSGDHLPHACDLSFGHLF